MPMVTRSMKAAEANEKSAMDVDEQDISQPSSLANSPNIKKRTRAARKRNRRQLNDESNPTQKRRKRRRVQQNSSDEDEEMGIVRSSPKKKNSSPKRKKTKKKVGQQIIQAVSKSQRTTTENDDISPEEVSRIMTMQEMERALYEDDCQYVVGTDEAGRGPLAGPVVSAACYIPLEVQIAQLTDSKALTEEQREEIYERLVNDDRVVYGVAVVSEKKIDEINILQAALLGMRLSCADVNEKLLARNESKENVAPTESKERDPNEDDAKDENHPPSGGVDYILVDGNRDPRFDEAGLNVRSETVVKGDGKVYCIAAASIIAKVTRDRLMVEYDKQYPLYNFAQHKGYPTPQHKALVAEHGPCEIHRRSFEPVKSLVGWSRPKKTQAKKKDATKKKGKGGKKTGKNKKSS